MQIQKCKVQIQKCKLQIEKWKPGARNQISKSEAAGTSTDQRDNALIH